MPPIVSMADLPGGEPVRRFEGGEHGSTISSFLVLGLPPGAGPVLHRHPYEETFFVLEGSATFTVDGETIEAHGGQIAIAPAGAPHKFVNSGDGLLRMVTVHPAARVEQEDLE